MPTSRAKEERMWDLANRLAKSGECTGLLQIEWELRERGYSRARQLLDDERTRERLDRMCAKARSEAAKAEGQD